MFDEPMIGEGVIFIVTTVVALHPAASVYVIIAVPAATPSREPDVRPMVATAVLPLSHVPPVIPSDSVVATPAHRLVAPVIAPGVGLTVRMAVRKPPPASVYVMVLVPADAPPATPEVNPMVATDVVPLTHVPPAEASV